MVSISTPTFDLNGHIILPKTKQSTVYEQSRRVTRSKTLDGGVSLADMGFAHGDRTFTIVSKNISQTDFDSVSYIQKNYPQVMLSIWEGIFIGAIESINITNGDLRMTYMLKEKLNSED